MEEDFLFEDGGLYNDDGSEIIPDLIPVPPLCLTCKKNGRRGEENILCTLTRAEYLEDEDFDCAEYEPMKKY